MEESLSKPLDDAALTDVDVQKGVIRSWISLGLGTAENTVATGFGLLNDVRYEAVAATDATIDYVERLSKGVFGLGRKARNRVDHLAVDSFKRGELAVNVLLQAIHRTGNSATELAAETAGAAVGERSAA